MNEGSRGTLGSGARIRLWTIALAAIAVLTAVFTFFTSLEDKSHVPAASTPPAPRKPHTPNNRGVALVKNEQTKPSADTSFSPEVAEFQKFTDWTTRYQTSDAAVRGILIDEGLQLARARRSALKSLIQTDPKTALALAVSSEARQALPKQVTDLLEEQVNGTGRMNVDCVLPTPGAPHAHEEFRRDVVIGAQDYHAYVYGKMTYQYTTRHMPVEGIAVDDYLAVAETTGYGGRAWGDASLGSSDITGRPEMSWTHGPKKVLMIRVDFADRPGDPIYTGNTNILVTTNFATSVFNDPNGVKDFYVASSYSNTDLLIEASPLYRMPTNALYYAQGDGNLDYSGKLRDAALAAASTNYNLSQYDRIGVVCSDLSSLPGSKVGFAGVANINGENFLINGWYNFAVLTHEIGHTYGVNHANWWKPGNNTTIGTEQDLMTNFFNGAITLVSKEYQDRFDTMGAQGNPVIDMRYEMNHWLKNILGWVPDTSVQTITNSGTYRVYRFDHPEVDLANHKVALKIGRDIRRDYWVGYRRQFTTNCNLSTGAYILFGYNFNRQSDLLVCNNPGVNVDNAALQVGQSLVDTNGGVTITTLAQGGVAPHEYLDIQVTLQPRVAFSSNFIAFETSAGTSSVVVDRAGNSSGTTTVNYACVDGTAISGTHYIGSSGTLTWGDGDTTSRTLTFPMMPYPATNGAKDFTVQLSNVANGVIINPGTITVSILPPGNPDPAYRVPSYGFGGVNSVMLQPDGRLLIAGWFQNLGEGGGKNFFAGRYARIKPNGARDYSFDSTIGADNQVFVIRRQLDGKVLLGGYFLNVNNVPHTRLVRLNDDGSFDNTFNPPLLDAKVADLAVQPDGKIVVVGDFRNVNGQPCLGVCRLLPNGSVDFIFNPPGYRMRAGNYKVALDNYGSSNPNDVRILVAGSLYAFPAVTQTKSGLVRLKSDGSIDASFDVKWGAHLSSNHFIDRQVYCIALQPDGKIVLGGTFDAFNDTDHRYLVRLNTDGSVDPAFNATVAGGSFTIVYGVLVQPDGKVMVGGTFDTVNGITNKNLMRLTSTGENDPAWDNGIGAANGCGTTVNDFTLLPDGRLFVAASQVHTLRGITGINSQVLYTGITNRYGIGQLAASAYGAGPGSTVNINVQRINGSSGAVKLDYSTQNGTAIAETDYTPAQGTLVWADGDSTPKTIAVVCNPSATLGRSFNLNLGIPRDGIQLGVTALTTITISYSYAAWMAQKFTLPQQGDPDISGINATPAGDGVSNLLKYALGLEPFTFASGTNMPAITIASDRLRMVFNRDPMKADLTYEVQASNDLDTWSALARSTGGSSTLNLNAFSVAESPANSVFTVTVDDSSTASTTPKRFFRLKVTK